jgi:hypothetical protein
LVQVCLGQGQILGLNFLICGTTLMEKIFKDLSGFHGFSLPVRKNIWNMEMYKNLQVQTALLTLDTTILQEAKLNLHSDLKRPF